MIDKLLRRFCAQEVQILIHKIEDDYDVFSSSHGWQQVLAASSTRATMLERLCIEFAQSRAVRGYKRKAFLTSILNLQLNPPVETPIGGAYTFPSSQFSNSVLTQSALANNSTLVGTAFPTHPAQLGALGQQAVNNILGQP